MKLQKKTNKINQLEEKLISLRKQFDKITNAYEKLITKEAFNNALLITPPIPPTHPPDSPNNP